MLDNEIVKLKIEGTSDYIKSGLVLKYNPFTENWYFKVGANYINQKMYAPDSSTARVNQYSGALATGYMIMDDLYFEIGGSATQLNGSMVGADYEVKNEKTNLAYLEVAKRWESFIGTIDTTANAGRVYHELSRDENSYGLAIDYYPLDNTKLGYKYQYEKNNILNVYSAQYGLAFVEYADNISTKTYQVTAGLKIAVGDFTDFSTYGIPHKIKPHLSELHRFEEVSFATNMNVQSSAGVSKTAAAVARDVAAAAVTISMADQTVNDNGGAGATVLPAPTVSNVDAGAVYSIVADPTGGKLTINAATGIATYDGDEAGDVDYTITIKVTNPDMTSATVTFTLHVINNL